MGWLLVLGLKDALVECMTVCHKIEVILLIWYVLISKFPSIYSKWALKFFPGINYKTRELGCSCIPQSYKWLKTHKKFPQKLVAQAEFEPGTFQLLMSRTQVGQDSYITMTEISISIENKYFRGEHKVITLKQQFLGRDSCIKTVSVRMDF